MKRLAATLFILMVAGIASAAQRTFVSAQQGLDTNPCSATQPCRTFGMAMTVTDAGGEVLALDSGGYGPVTIAQAVSIVAPSGVYAGVTTTAAGTNAITVNAPSAVVTLRGLTLNGLNGTGIYGIDAIGAPAELHVEGLHVYGFSSTGIACYAGGTYFVNDTAVRNSHVGFYAASTDINAPARVTINRSTFEANAMWGVNASGYSKVTVRDTVANGNGVGFEAGDTAGIAEIEMHHCEAAFNGNGVFAANTGLAVINVSTSHITENDYGVVRVTPSAVYSAGDNVLRYNNTSDGSFVSTFAKQ